jgi:hypothetical protein
MARSDQSEAAKGGLLVQMDRLRSGFDHPLDLERLQGNMCFKGTLPRGFQLTSGRLSLDSLLLSILDVAAYASKLRAQAKGPALYTSSIAT